MKRFLMPLCFIMAVGCNGKKQPAAPVANAAAVSVSIMDTIQKYAGRDSTNLSFNGTGGLSDYFYAGKVGSGTFALWVLLERNEMLFYNMVDGKWLAPDTVHNACNFSAFQRTDLNGDGHKDLYFTQEDNCITAFIYDAATGRFRNNHHFELPNISYDAQHKLVRSYDAIPEPEHRHERTTYTIAGDSLMRHEGVIFQPGNVAYSEKFRQEENYVHIDTLTYYTVTNGERKITRQMHGTSAAMLREFTQALW